jgi:exodeoxyribonuclease-1
MFKEREGPLRKVKANASPLLFPLYDALETTFPNIIEDDVVRLARSIRTDEKLTARLNAAAFAAEHVYGDSSHVEQQLYDRFIPDNDKPLMQQFHAVPWDQRFRVVRCFSDDRLRRLGQRVIYFEMPHLISEEIRTSLDAAVRSRWTGDPSMPWMTASKAIAEMESIAPGQEHPNLANYAVILGQTLDPQR